MAQGFGLGKEVLQGIGIGVVMIVCGVLVGNRIATAGHDHAEEEFKSHGPNAPTDMRHIEVTPEKVALGAEQFSNCTVCHGNKGEGKIGIAPRLNSESLLAAASDTYLYETISQGRSGTTMVAFKNTMTQSQIEAVIAYLRDTFKSEPVTLDESPLKGDAESGKKIYADVCAACHGVQGAGYQETANGTGIGRRGFLDKATNGFIRHIAKHGKTGTQMKPMIGAKTAVTNLTEEEIDSVIHYLRDHSW